MIDTYKAIKKAGLRKVRIGNTGVFAKTHNHFEQLNHETDGCY